MTKHGKLVDEKLLKLIETFNECNIQTGDNCQNQIRKGHGDQVWITIINFICFDRLIKMR